MGKRRRKNGGSSAAGIPVESKVEEFPQGGARIEIDGSMHEGGGQMVRTSVGLAGALGVSCEVSRIRAGRSKPGLRAQHIAGAELVAKLCDGRLYGACMHSTRLRYEPPNKCGDADSDSDGNGNGNGNMSIDIDIDIGTAGATSLVLQASLPAMIAQASATGKAVSFKINGGGTHVPHAPTADYVELVLIPTALKFGVILKYDVHRQGFFPRGGGQVSVSVQLDPNLEAPVLVPLPSPSPLPRPWVQLKREKVTRVYGLIIVGINSLRIAAENLRKGVRKVLRKGLGDTFQKLDQRTKNEENEVIENEGSFEVVETRSDNGGPSLAITLVAETENNGRFGASRILDARSCRDSGYSSVQEGAMEIGEAVASELVEDLTSGAAVDRHMADQIMVFMGLAGGKSCVRVPAVTLHMRSMEEVLKRFGINCRFEYKENDAGGIEMHCDGLVTNITTASSNGQSDSATEEER